MFFREPIVPVIKKFWYKPDSGIDIFVLFLKSYPIKRDNLEESNLIEFIFLSFFLLNFKNLELINLDIFGYKKLLIMIFENINVITYTIFIYFQSSGFFEQISKGWIPYVIMTSCEI